MAASAAERFLAAIREQRPQELRRLLRAEPELARSSVFAAAAAGEVDHLAAKLRRDPQLARARDGEQWTPLLHAAASPLHRDGAARRAAIVRAAALLLEHGADPNEHVLFQDDPKSPLPALYFACVAGNAPLVRLLLERGADPNDGESVYHAAELDRRPCLALLLRHGAEISAAHARWGNTPLYFLAGYHEVAPRAVTVRRGIQWLLEHGADPNVPSYESRETPLHRIVAHGWGPAMAELLVAHAAEVDRPRADGRTAYVLALRAGNARTADWLAAHGADTSRATAADRFLAACHLGDESAARTLLAAHPGLLAAVGDEGSEALCHAAAQGRIESVRVMSALGFDLAGQGSWAGTPLHRACWWGQAATVRELLALGAPIAARDREYGSSALGWAAHGSRFCRRGSEHDYLAIIDTLHAAGARREEAVNRFGEPPENLASPRVAARLRRLGLAPRAIAAKEAP